MKKMSVAIIDYSMGNTKSIENAIQHVGDFNCIITSNEDEIFSSDVIILPGVGAFPDAMKKLNEKGLVPILNKVVNDLNKPVLGICLGMQLLFESSEEKVVTQGLGWIPGKIIYMKPAGSLRVPHIGWNNLLVTPSDSLFSFLGRDKDFYFVHSLHAVCDDKYVLAKFDYGDLMNAVVKNHNVVGMQFHPEKSQKNGLSALHAFFQWANLFIGGKNA